MFYICMLGWEGEPCPRGGAVNSLADLREREEVGQGRGRAAGPREGPAGRVAAAPREPSGQSRRRNYLATPLGDENSCFSVRGFL